MDSLSALTGLISKCVAFKSTDEKGSEIKTTLQFLFDDRYHSRHLRNVVFRDAYALSTDGVPWAGMIGESQPPSGAYGGASIAWFPIDGASLMTFVVGTKGLAPDEGLLTRPGHRRRVAALRRHLTQLGVVGWAKPEPAAINVDMPDAAQRLFSGFDGVFKRYGSVIYCAALIPSDLDSSAARSVVQAFFDLYAYERNWGVRAEIRQEFDRFLGPLRNAVFPKIEPADINGLLRQRRFVVLQGPPGTGKTRMAELIRRDYFGGRGRTVQFHPAVTYEDFVVGLSPDPTKDGLRFEAKPGWLVQAAHDAGELPYLLIIDEINRGDLGKVLGEAIYLFEPTEVGGRDAREVSLAHSVNGRNTFRMPENLYVLATMNTADRSIAGMDLAVRRRFAFATLMPDRAVIEHSVVAEAIERFDAIADVFVEHASDDMLDLLPGHSYFLADSESELRDRMRYELIPPPRRVFAPGAARSSEQRAQRRS